MSKIPVSVCIIAKNEEKHIENCLSRLKPYGFEIVVTDTGSTDRTKEIAQKYADKVLDFEWIDDFAAARNFCAENASNNWIIALDCDEYVSHIDVSALRIGMQKYAKRAGMFRLMSIINNSDGTQGYATNDVTRIYNKNFYTFINPIHEQIVRKKPEDRSSTMQCFEIPVEIIHHGYCLEGDEMVKKQERNLKLLYKALENDPDDIYTLFQIGQSLFMLERDEEAAKYYEKAMSYNPSTKYDYVQEMIISLAKVYIRIDRQNDALALMEKYENEVKTAKFTYILATAYLHADQPLKSLLYYVKTTMMDDYESLGNNMVSCYENIIGLYRAMDDDKMADLFQNKYDKYLKEKERILNA